MVNKPINLDNRILSKSVNLSSIDCQDATAKENPKILIWDLVDKELS